MEDLSKHKKITLTATTGMACLQFHKAMTIHKWSGYVDGHMNTDRLIEQIVTNPAYADTK